MGGGGLVKAVGSIANPGGEQRRKNGVIQNWISTRKRNKLAPRKFAGPTWFFSNGGVKCRRRLSDVSSLFSDSVLFDAGLEGDGAAGFAFEGAVDDEG